MDNKNNTQGNTSNSSPQTTENTNLFAPSVPLKLITESYHPQPQNPPPPKKTILDNIKEY